LIVVEVLVVPPIISVAIVLVHVTVLVIVLIVEVISEHYSLIRVGDGSAEPRHANR